MSFDSEQTAQTQLTEQKPTISVPEFRDVPDVKPGSSHIEYRVDSHGSGRLIASTWRRYHDFVAINKQLAGARAPLLNLPPKKPFGGVNVDERRVWLQCALQMYVESHSPLPQHLAKFLHLDGVDPALLQAHADAERLTSNCGTNGALDTSDIADVQPVVCTTSVPSSPPSIKDAARTGELMQASAALTSAITIAEQFVPDSWWQKQRTKLAAALLVVALAARRSHRSAGRSLSVFLLGACTGSWVAILAGRGDRCIQAKALESVSEKAQELSLKILAICRSSESALPRQRTESHDTITRENYEFVESPLSSATPSPPLSQLPQEAAPLPKTLTVFADHMSEMLIGNLREDLNAYNLPWEIAQKNKDFETFASKVPGQARKVWKSRFKVTSPITFDQLEEATVDWENRLKWDPSFEKGTVLKSFEGGYDICHCSTRSLLSISSRDFVQLRFTSGCREDGILLQSFASLTSEIMEGPSSPAKGIVRGDMKPGCGVRWTLLPSSGPEESSQRCWLVEVVAETDLKGWIPVPILNRAMLMSLSENCTCMTKYFNNFPPPASTSAAAM